jgi:hypothetical protein
VDRANLKILLLADDRRDHAGTVLAHIHAFRRFSRHRVDIFNPRGLRHSRLLRFGDYDVVVIHYSIFILSDSYLAPWFREQLSAFSGLKVQFLQDDYRWVDAITAQMRELGIDVLFTLADADTIPLVFGSRLPGVDILPTLTGYVPPDLENYRCRPLEDRSLDVVYRGRSVPFWLGRLGQEKVLIGREFLARAASTDLRCDISSTEADRIYGEAWYRFIGSSRTTLGTESGASIVDFDGSLQERTDTYLRNHPTATFEEVEREILAPFEGNVVMNVVSPRVFEAAALGTAMINFPGRYSTVIEPWTHYLPLEKDFSNFEDVVAAIHDDGVLEQLALRAHSDVVASGRYSLRTFVREFEHELETRVRFAERSPRQRPMAVLARGLLGVEQLRSRDRRAELPFLVSLSSRAAARTARRLIQHFPEMEALSTQADRDGPDDRAQRVRRDLVRLATAAAAHLRELRYVGPPFDVRVDFDDKGGRLMLVGVRDPSPDESERHRLHGQVTRAIREDRLQEIVWDNKAVSESLMFFSFPVSWLKVGYHVVAGAHRFTALEELAHNDPEGVVAALAPLFRKRPDAPVDELGHRTALLAKLLWRPGSTAARGTASLRAALMTNELRPLLLAYVRSSAARAEAPPQLVLKDFFNLRLVAAATTSLELDASRKSLVFRTVSVPGDGVRLDATMVGSLEQIVWDHSAGSLVTFKERPRVAVIPEGGVHDFRALTSVARRFPELALPALRWAAKTE